METFVHNLQVLRWYSLCMRFHQFVDSISEVYGTSLAKKKLFFLPLTGEARAIHKKKYLSKIYCIAP